MSNGKPFQGGPGCPSYTAPAFGSLYINDPPAPPDPIDGPVPASPYIIPLPAPTPCTCLSFDVLPKPETPRLRLVPPSIQPKGLGITLTPKDENNCCDGRFEVTTDLELPCIPFTLNPGDAKLNIQNTPDASAAAFRRFGISQEYCALTPAVELDLPCVPTPTYEYQISGYDRGTYETGEVQRPEITGTPCAPTVLTKLDMPCPIRVDAQELAFSTGTPGTVTLHLEQEDGGCGVRLVSTVDQQPGQECPISVSDTTMTVSLTKAEPHQVPSTQQLGLRLTKTADCGIGLALVGSPTLYVPAYDKQVTDVRGKLENGVFYICVKYKNSAGTESEECHEAFKTLAHSRCMD